MSSDIRDELDDPVEAEAVGVFLAAAPAIPPLLVLPNPPCAIACVGVVLELLGGVAIEEEREKDAVRVVDELGADAGGRSWDDDDDAVAPIPDARRSRSCCRRLAVAPALTLAAELADRGASPGRESTALICSKSQP